MSVILITGGARSGKSRQAETRALALADMQGLVQVSYVATGEAFDPEFALRIAHHQQSRSKRFWTVEEALEICRGVQLAKEHSSVVLWECVSTWLGNVFHHFPHAPEEYALGQLAALESFLLAEPDLTLLVVSNELGMGLVPADAVSRQYRDVHGRINCRIANMADEAWMVVAGLPIRLK
jgi:adenosylcobinamide kinase/adenosylcobinamide-phosphate guanylyltransferase